MDNKNLYGKARYLPHAKFRKNKRSDWKKNVDDNIKCNQKTKKSNRVRIKWDKQEFNDSDIDKQVNQLKKKSEEKDHKRFFSANIQIRNKCGYKFVDDDNMRPLLADLSDTRSKIKLDDEQKSEDKMLLNAKDNYSPLKMEPMDCKQRDMNDEHIKNISPDEKSQNSHNMS